MRQKRLIAAILFAAAALVAVPAVTVMGDEAGEGGASVSAAAALGDAISYQGRLTEEGAPANGVYDFRFTLYNELVGGTQRGNIVVHENVLVDGGLFTAFLEFGANAFDGEGRWLELAVRPGSQSGDAGFTTLSPRQLITGAPYALFAKTSAALALPFAAMGAADGTDAVFAVTNTGSGDALVGLAGAGSGVRGAATAPGGIGLEGTGSIGVQGSGAIGGRFSGDTALQVDGGIQVTGNERPAYRIVATTTGSGQNTCDGDAALVIDNPFTNGDESAFVLVTPVGAAYGVGVAYDAGGDCPANRWAILRDDAAPFADGDELNVLIIRDDTTQ